MTTNPTTAAGELRGVFDQVFTTQDFALESGRLLPELKIAFETYGRLAPDRRNVVLLTHGYTSNHHMVGRAGSTLAEGLWNSLVGPGKAVDTDRCFVVSSNMLGSSYGSTGPAHTDPATGRPYGPDFPEISLVDIVTAQRTLLRHLGIDHLVAVIGPSYGGVQAFQWAVTFPDFMDGIVPVTAGIKSNGGAGLAALLAEKDHSHMARYALERIGAAEAAAALRDALPKLAGALKVGVIGSLGARRDAASVPLLAGLLGNADTAVACSAALALGVLVVAAIYALLPPILDTPPPLAALSPDQRQAMGWVVGLVIFGLLVPGINNWAHGGGLAAGVDPLSNKAMLSALGDDA